ncbi:MAG: heme exporter protein CcmD [Pseudomonadota bacterium]
MGERTVANMNLSDFFAMGGYAEYVWSAFAISAIVIVANVVASQSHRRRVIAEISEINGE